MCATLYDNFTAGDFLPGRNLTGNVTPKMKYGSEKMLRNEKISVFLLTIVLFLAGILPVSADDAASMAYFRKGAEKEKSGSWLSAAAEFEEAHVQADDPVLKANALMNIARCCRKAQQYGKEFDVLQSLINGHVSRINFTAVVQRQYEIATLFFKGHRDTFVSWLPFIKKDDRTAELFQTVLENAPCAEPAPEIRLALGRIYLNGQQPEKAAEEFKKTVQLYPETKEAKYAALELANVYVQQAENGDGDGKYAKEATEVLNLFLEKHPGDSETAWVRESLKKVNSYTAKRYCKLGDFYRKEGNNETAERYYALVLTEYPDTPEAETAEKKLAELDKDFTSSRKVYSKEEKQFIINTLPEEQQTILVAPEDSNGRWLLPVRNIRSTVSAPAKTTEQSEVVDDDAL